MFFRKVFFLRFEINIEHLRAALPYLFLCIYCIFFFRKKNLYFLPEKYSCVDVLCLIYLPIRGDPWAVSEGGKKSKRSRRKFGRRKVKNDEKSPWRKGLNGPVPNGRGSSGFYWCHKTFVFLCPITEQQD